jgi:hypothetical protein
VIGHGNKKYVRVSVKTLNMLHAEDINANELGMGKRFVYIKEQTIHIP